MATKNASAVESRLWKEHTCVCCGAVYAYRADLDATSRGKASYARQFGLPAPTDLECKLGMEPCPTCGMYQPDMVLERRPFRHWTAFCLTAGCFIVILVLYGAGAIRGNIATYAVAGVCAAAALRHWAIVLDNPNRNIDANRQLAEQRVAAGLMRHAPGVTPAGGRPSAHSPKSLAQSVALLLLLAAVGLAAAPEILRIARGWALNADCDPPVVGPGDQTRIDMKEELQSIKGYWWGRATVAVHEAGSPDKPIAVGVSTNDDQWGGRIETHDSSEIGRASTPWVRIELPTEGALAGESLAGSIELEVNYPEALGGLFKTRSTTMKRDFTLRAASVGAAAQYRLCRRAGTTGGIALALTCPWVLIVAARVMQRRAPPARTYA